MPPPTPMQILEAKIRKSMRGRLTPLLEQPFTLTHGKTVYEGCQFEEIRINDQVVWSRYEQET